MGEPDFPPAVEVREAIKEAVDLNLTRYTAVSGTLELRQAICDDLSRRKNVIYTPEQVVVSNGGKQSILQALLAKCEPNDEVVVPTPAWTSYVDMIRMARARPILVRRDPKLGYPIDADLLRPYLSSRTRILILNSPCNPSGAVFSKSALQGIADLLHEPQFAHITILSDEIYEHLVYDDCEHVCFASLEGMQQRTMLINGFSKGHAMTGLRLGYLCAPTKLALACAKVQSQMTSCACATSQHAGVAALTKVPDVWFRERRAELQQKRDFVVNALSQMEHVICETPQGAFYCLPDISAYLIGPRISTSEQFCTELLEKHRLALVPGEAFEAPATVRISYAASMDDLEKAMATLGQFLVELGGDLGIEMEPSLFQMRNSLEKLSGKLI